MKTNLFQKILLRGLATLRSLAPGRAERDFIAANSRFWRRHQSAAEPAGYVLVEHQDNPIINHCNASFAAIVCQARGLRPLYVLNIWRDVASRRVLPSYARAPAFVHTNGLRYLWPRLLCFFQAWCVFRSLRNPADILDFRIDGIRFGDIIYDNTLLLGNATIRRVDIKVFAVLYAFHVHRHIIKDIVRRYRPVTTVLSHTIGLVGATYSRYLLGEGIEVINRVGSNQIILKKYRELSEVGFYPLKPEPRYFTHMRDREAGRVVKLANAYLDERHSQRVKQIAVELAFDRGKRLFQTRQEFCEHYRFDAAKKTVFVMLHAFDDHPHSHFARRMLYQDYFDWFRRTLEVAKTTPSVSWVFKEHPASQFHSTKDADLDALFSAVSLPHIRFLNSTADFNALSIRFLADVIVTCLGTAGMEYACLGIPCLLAGESPYSGFGFTLEPDSIADYENQLRNLGTLPRLNLQQVESAKMVMFFELAMLLDSPYHFCPEYDYRTTMTLTPQNLWRDLANLMQNPEQAVLENQVVQLTEFICDRGYTQYLNLAKYPFMKNGIQRDERHR